MFHLRPARRTRPLEHKRQSPRTCITTAARTLSAVAAPECAVFAPAHPSHSQLIVSLRKIRRHSNAPFSKHSSHILRRQRPITSSAAARRVCPFVSRTRPHPRSRPLPSTKPRPPPSLPTSTTESSANTKPRPAPLGTRSSRAARRWRWTRPGRRPSPTPWGCSGTCPARPPQSPSRRPSRRTCSQCRA